MNTREENTPLSTPFWPLCIMALSLAVFMGWQVTTAAQQYFALLRLADQQTVMTGQAAQAESQLKALMMDLLQLSKTDADARAIVSKYGIKFNPAPSLVTPSHVTPASAVLPAPRSPRAQRDKAAGSGTLTDDNEPRKPRE